MESISIIDKLVNTFISMDKESADSLSKFKGKHLHVELANTRTVVCIEIMASRLGISYNCDLNADVRVRGTPLELLNYIRGMKQAQTIQARALEISGDIALAQNLQLIISGMDIDWEERLSTLIGDGMAHKAGKAVKGTVNFIINFNETVVNGISEYLRYEKGVIINAEELDEFCHGVDSLRDDAARLKAKIDRIHQSRNKT